MQIGEGNSQCARINFALQVMTAICFRFLFMGDGAIDCHLLQPSCKYIVFTYIVNILYALDWDLNGHP